MRPKTVILILGVTVAIVVLAAVLKGVIGGQNSPESRPSEGSIVESSGPSNREARFNPTSSNSLAVLEQLHAEELAKELDQIHDLLADGGINPHATGMLVGKMVHKEPEVRKAALQALVQLGDTNAIPGLEQVQGLTEDPREKVALMDAIVYLKLPPANMPEGAEQIKEDLNSQDTGNATNKQPEATRQFAPRKQRGRGAAPAGSQLPVPASPDQVQPAPAAPNAAPPQ